MRVLYLSRADQFDDRSSLVIIAKSMFKHMLAADPELYVTWVVPRGVKDEVLTEFILRPLGENARRMTFLKAMPGLAGRTLGYMMTEDVWYALTQTKADVPYDVVLSNQLALTPIWHTVLTNRYMNSRYAVKVPIVNWQMWTATTQQLREVPEYYAGEPDIVAESLASLFAENIWESEVLYQAHLETIRQYVVPSVLKKVTAQSHVIANGVDWPSLEAVYERRQQRTEQACLFWGGRLSNQKKPRITFPLMQRVATVTGCPVRVTTNRPEHDPDVAWTREQFPNWELLTKADRSTFYEQMSQGDVFMCDSPSESYGVAWLEMLAAGLLGVFAPAWWNKTLLPDWYPFVSESAEERVAMTVALLNDWPNGPLWTKYVPMIREWIEQEHNERRSAGRIAELLRRKKAEAIEEDRGKWGATMGDLVVQAAEKAAEEYGDVLPEKAVWEQMKALSDADRDWGKQGDIVSRMYLRRLMEGRGWRDRCRGPEVEFVRSEQ